MMPAVRNWRRWSLDCRLVVTSHPALQAAAQVADTVMDDVELAISRFRPDSELCRLHPGWNDVSPLLAELVDSALAAARTTGGAVDPTVGSCLERLGYTGALPVTTGDGPRGAVAPGWRAIRLRGNRLHLPAGVRLDLGATGKAATADLVATAVRRRTGSGVLVSLGGDIATAGHGPRGGWRVRVQDLPTDAPVHVVLADGAAIATSSSEHRTWIQDGRRVHHLVDPATGLPAAGPWRTATMVARSCLQANVLATAAIVKGAGAVPWLTGAGAPGRLVSSGGAVHCFEGFPVAVAA